MIKICCLSDLHGNLPPIPECDLLLLGGDFCLNSNDYMWYSRKLKPWVDYASNKCEVIAVAGNHDLIFQDKPYLVPEMNWSYLEDSGVEWNGWKIWGSPWQPRYYDWAFNLDEPELENKWSLIPDDTDILLLHGPPYGYGDKAEDYLKKEHGTKKIEYKSVGSPSLLKRIQEIKPKLVVAGHIHNGYGRYDIGSTIFVNASLVNNSNIPMNYPIVVEL